MCKMSTLTETPTTTLTTKIIAGILALQNKDYCCFSVTTPPKATDLT